MTGSKTVLVIQHSDKESLGILGIQLVSSGIDYSYVRPFSGEKLPVDLNMFSGLIILGGPQSAYQENEFPYLSEEKAFLKKAIVHNLPMLGICLGSQLIAETLGSSVSAGPKMQVGFEPVNFNKSFLDNHAIQGITNYQVHPLHWHKDIYNIPPESSVLASSENTQVEGFVWKDNVWGLLFHLEPELAQIEDMANHFTHDLLEAGISKVKLLRSAEEYLQETHKTGEAIFSNWIRYIK